MAARALLAWAAMPIDIQSDEANYIFAALGLERFGVYIDQHRYIWPPGYPWLISVFLTPEGGTADLNHLRFFQVIISSITGITTMLFAWRLFSGRAAVIAGSVWAVYLPLGAYTHLLWTESFFLVLFLPALWHLLVAMDRASQGSVASSTRRFLLSGVLFGGALYFKELPLFLLPLLALLVFGRALLESAGAVEGIRRALLVPLAAMVVLLPWTLRNYEVYGRAFVSGATLGENVYIGMNSRYMNFDHYALRRVRAQRDLPRLHLFQRKGVTEPPVGVEVTDINRDGIVDVLDAGWARADDVVHSVDRQGAQVRRGLAYGLSHPAWLLRTRLKKWADLVAPVSFFTRHHALGKYSEERVLGGALRRPTIAASALMSAALMILALAGFFFTLQRGPGRQLLGVLFGYVALTSLLVAMSRFRVPLDPFLIVLSAGFLAHGWSTRRSLRGRSLQVAAFGVSLAVLVGLWWLSWPETMMHLDMGWTANGDGA